MATAAIVTGYEGGLLSANAGGLCDIINGSPTIQSTIKRTGSYALRCTVTGTAAACNIAKTISTNIICGRIYFLWHVRPSAQVAVYRVAVAAGSGLKIMFNPSDDTLCGQISTDGTHTAALTVDTWYRVDFEFDTSTGTSKLDLALNGTSVSQLTYTQAATTMNGMYTGFYAAVTGDVVFDDMFLSFTAGEHPIGEGQVEGTSPASDGTHNAGTNVIEAQDGTDIGTTTAYDKLNSVPIGNETTYVKQSATGTGNYAEVKFATTSRTVIHGVGATLAYKSSGTSSNKGATVIIRSDSTELSVYGTSSTPADMSESTVFQKCVALTPPAGGWTQTEVNALKCRIGYSSDVNPVPYWLDLILEIDVSPSVSLVIQNAAHAQTADNVGLTQHNLLVIQDAAQGQTADAPALVQHNVLSVQNAAHAQAADNVTLTAHAPTTTLVIQDATHAQTADNIALTQHNILVVQDALQSQTAESFALTQHNILTANDATHAQVATEPILGVGLVVNDATHALTSENVTLTFHAPGTSLTIQDATHAQAAENVSLVQHNVLTIANATHLQTADNVSLTQHNVLSIDGAVHGQTATIPTLIFHGAFEGAGERVLLSVAERTTLTPDMRVTLYSTERENLTPAKRETMIPAVRENIEVD